MKLKDWPCPQKVGQHGQLQEWPEDWDEPDDSHPHVSYLIALHPGRDISPLANTAFAEAAHTSLTTRSVSYTGAKSVNLPLIGAIFDNTR